MKLSKLTLMAAALALAGSAAFAQDATVTRTVRVGPDGGVTHVTKRVDENGTTTVRRVHRVTHATPVVVQRRVVVHRAPVVVHRRVVYVAPAHRHHHRHVAYVVPHHDRYAFTRHGEVHYAASPRPAHHHG
jgi:hypothetical protein